MIIQNGFIQFLVEGERTFDDFGRPVLPSSAYGCCIPCQFYPNSHNDLARSQGEAYTSQSYTILIEPTRIQQTGRLKLTDIGGHEIGEFSVRQREPLVAVHQIRFIV